MSLRTPLARARGLGSAKGGTEHFWQQRLTAVANLVLISYLLYVGVALAGADHQTVRAFFAAPVNAVMMILLALNVSVHARLGMQVIIEDYVHGKSRVPLIILNIFYTILVAVVCVVSVMKLTLGA